MNRSGFSLTSPTPPILGLERPAGERHGQWCVSDDKGGGAGLKGGACVRVRAHGHCPAATSAAIAALNTLAACCSSTSLSVRASSGAIL